MRFVQRNPGIDVLRAIAMLLGIFLHGAIPYKKFPHRNWIHDVNTNFFFDFVYFFIHSFRMPVFFIIAGFFCNHLLGRYAIGDFIKNRLTRVGLPFVIGTLLIIPFTLFPYTINNLMTSEGYSFYQAVKKGLPSYFSFKGLAHLWFLYDLLIFYAMVIILKKSTFIRKYFVNARNNFDKIFSGKYGLIWISLPVWVLLIPNEDLYLITDTYLIPRRPLNLFVFGYLFYIGYLIYSLETIINRIILNYKTYLIVSLLLLIVLFGYHIYFQNHPKDIYWYLMKLLVSVQIISGSLGLIGLFISEIKEENYYVRYIADASYWIYIIHLSIILYLQVLFLSFDFSSFIKYLIAILATTFISLISYELFIRYSVIGKVLHGPKKRSNLNSFVFRK